MDAIYEYGKENGWKQAEYKQAVSEIIKNERADLRGGKTILNKNSVRKARC
jgi:hypothetical protein